MSRIHDWYRGPEYWGVQCWGCGTVSEVLDATDLPRDWAARVEGGDLVRHYCSRCDAGPAGLVAAGRRSYAGAGRPGTR